MLHVVGIDIGSVALSVAVVDTGGVLVHSSYKFHRGAIAETMKEMLHEVDIKTTGGIAMTASGPDILDGVSPLADIMIASGQIRRHGKVFYLSVAKFPVHHLQ